MQSRASIVTNGTCNAASRKCEPVSELSLTMPPSPFTPFTRQSWLPIARMKKKTKQHRKIHNSIQLDNSFCSAPLQFFLGRGFPHNFCELFLTTADLVYGFGFAAQVESRLIGPHGNKTSPQTQGLYYHSAGDYPHLCPDDISPNKTVTTENYSNSLIDRRFFLAKWDKKHSRRLRSLLPWWRNWEQSNSHTEETDKASPSASKQHTQLQHCTNKVSK